MFIISYQTFILGANLYFENTLLRFVSGGCKVSYKHFKSKHLHNAVNKILF
jgi:hypothetical protein